MSFQLGKRPVFPFVRLLQERKPLGWPKGRGLTI